MFFYALGVAFTDLPVSAFFSYILVFHCYTSTDNMIPMLFSSLIPASSGILSKTIN